MRKQAFFYGSIIAVSFLWTGSAFISLTYHMMAFFTAAQLDMYMSVGGYLMQVLGMAAVAAGAYLRPEIFQKKHFFAAVLILEAVVITAALQSSLAAVVLLLSFLMNLLHGAVAGCYLANLAAFVPQQYRGRAFGFGYAVGCLGSWLLSLVGDGNFLGSSAMVFVYLFLIVLTLLLNFKAADIRTGTNIAEQGGGLKPKLLLLAFVVVMLLSLVKNIGFYFPVADFSNIVNLEFSRAFYAFGLVIAGIVNDKNRKYGAICCLAALVFPFISFVLPGGGGYAAALWIAGYIFFGFFAVYRVVVFSDIAAKKRSLLPLAAFGLLAGRTGDAFGTLAGIFLSGNLVSILAVTAGLFVIVVFLFFALYGKLYLPILYTDENREVFLESFERKYALTKRESEVFRLVLQGCSNSEISGKLYVSESTVKFHIGNILKKTACINRSELTLLFETQERPMK